MEVKNVLNELAAGAKEIYRQMLKFIWFLWLAYYKT
jgi:hypothetical protein